MQTSSHLPVCYSFRPYWLYKTRYLELLVSSSPDQSSRSFLQERIFEPLGMTRSATRAADQPTHGTFALGYSELGDGSLLPLSPSVLDDGSPQGGAGYVSSSVRDMLTWARAVLEAEADNYDQDHALNAEKDGNDRRNPHRQMQLQGCGHRPITLQGSGYQDFYGLGRFAIRCLAPGLGR